MMFGGNLLETIVGGIAAVAISFLGGMVYDHNYGANAWELARIKNNTVATNGRVDQQNADDPLIVAKEAEQVAQAKAKYQTVAPHLEKCVLDKDRVEAINARLEAE